MNKIIYLTMFVLVGTVSVSLCQNKKESETKSKEKQTAVKNEKSNTESGKKEAAKKGINFVDKNGDGFNDNAPDDDGDGIPNCLDPDYKGKRKGFVDKDGDGINDNAGRGKMKQIGISGAKGSGSNGAALKKRIQKGKGAGRISGS